MIISQDRFSLNLVMLGPEEVLNRITTNMLDLSVMHTRHVKLKQLNM